MLQDTSHNVGLSNDDPFFLPPGLPFWASAAFAVMPRGNGETLKRLADPLQVFGQARFRDRLVSDSGFPFRLRALQKIV